MTYRLVGLMSIVLLVSLAAFALLMSHFQDEFMGELARTVSEVGRATLETLEFGPASDQTLFRTLEGELLAAPDDAAEGDRRTESRKVLYFSTGTISPAPAQGYVVIDREGQPPRHIPLQPDKECDPLSEEPRIVVERHLSTVVEDIEAIEARGGMTVIRLDAIRAEEEPGKGLLLRIPALRTRETKDTSSFQMSWTSAEEPGASVGDPVARREEFTFQVPTDDYKNIFSTLRSRSGFVFLGVFLLGTALSAGLATRFTRPVRRLDAAIHRLSEGDLDVQVDARGRDEVARLGRAFNDMARKLRIGRDRARELTRREKLSALGRLAAGVAHDVRNPLHSIGLTLQHLQEAGRPEAPERQSDFDRSLAMIRDEIRRLDRLVENFLQFARSDRRERVPVGLPDLVRETVRLVEKEAERRGVTVEVVSGEPVDAVPVDAESVRAAILNLVLNSFEAMPEGGTLRIEVEQRDGQVVLKVSDTGRGIPEEDRERVFDFAYTTRDDGHGLGLAMVHQVVVEEHGGRVTLDSRPGEGTRVSLIFPVVPPAAEATS